MICFDMYSERQRKFKDTAHYFFYSYTTIKLVNRHSLATNLRLARSDKLHLNTNF